MGLNTIIYEKDEGIGIITFNWPENLNAISSEFMSELNQVLDDMGSDDEIQIVIVTGGDKVFAAGADIKELANIGTPADAYRFSKKDQLVFQKLVNLRVSVIAAVAGLAYGGGCEIALQCDIRIAADNAKFAQPEIKLGLLPGAGGTQRLPRLIGVGRAKEFLFSGDPVDAKEAYRIGLVNKVVPAELLMEESKKMAKTFLERPGYALMMIKQLVNTGINMDLNSALEYEARCFEILFSTEDQKEGLNAFIEKRKPVFQNR
jgi:enoyl-CoA hydratase